MNKIIGVITSIFLFALVGLFYSQNTQARLDNPPPFLFIASNITPDANNTRDLGAYSNAFNDIFVSGTAYIDQVSSTRSRTLFDSVSTTGAVTIGNSADALDLTQARIVSSVRPDLNNKQDLGIRGQAWNEVFVSGTLFADGRILLTSSTITSTIHLQSGLANRGGQIELEIPSTGQCVFLYIGDPQGDGIGPLELTSSTPATCTDNTLL